MKYIGVFMIVGMSALLPIGAEPVMAQELTSTMTFDKLTINGRRIDSCFSNNGHVDCSKAGSDTQANLLCRMLGAKRATRRGNISTSVRKVWIVRRDGPTERPYLAEHDGGNLLSSLTCKYD